MSGLELDGAVATPARAVRTGWLSPTTVVGVALALYLGLTLVQAGGDPLAFVVLGDGFRDGQPIGEQGYDGQFAYWIAVDPRPRVAAQHLDVPAYRYQRLLHPLLARTLAAGQPALIPWTLLFVNISAHLAGTWLLEQWLAARAISRWYALTYGLWAGLVMAVRLDLAEPLCFGLVVGAWLAIERRRLVSASALLAAALFAKETALIFALALLVWAALQRNWRAVSAFALALAPFLLFQALLVEWFGAPGIGAGGFMGTGFEWVPFMGLWRVAGVSWPAFVLLAVIFGPLVVLPSVWGLFVAVRRLLTGASTPATFALGANAFLIAVAPFSTFREPLGLIRLATGLVLSTIMFGAEIGSKRVLNYSLFWIAALALAVRS